MIGVRFPQPRCDSGRSGAADKAAVPSILFPTRAAAIMRLVTGADDEEDSNSGHGDAGIQPADYLVLRSWRRAKGKWPIKGCDHS